MEIPYGYCHCGCGNKTRISDYTSKARGYIKGEPRRFIYGHHVGKVENHPNWRGGRTKHRKYFKIRAIDHPRNHCGYINESTAFAEKALGKLLPLDAVVHHHTPQQLVICQDRSYHNLLHLRTKAYYACGNASWRRCIICGKWDAPENMYVPSKKGSARHRECHTQKEKERRNRD